MRARPEPLADAPLLYVIAIPLLQTLIGLSTPEHELDRDLCKML